MIQNSLNAFDANLEALLDRIKSRYSSRLPFRGWYVDKFGEFVRNNVNALRGVLENAFTEGHPEYAVNFVIDYARGNLKLGWPWSMVANVFLESLRAWLLRNPSVFQAIATAKVD